MQPPMTFSMPMFNDFVPEKIRPWIYLCIAMCFQLSGARYLGPLNEIIGADGLMREDILMCMYCNLAGMALWFPMLFRMKFRFSNKQLLTAASITVIITNLLTAYVTFLPLLWFICFVEGIAKIQGTFECMSNIQLWMTPKRDMKIFFPILHVVILSAIAFQDLLSSYFGYLGDWRLMHYFVIGLQCIVLLILTTCVHHFKFTNQPLYGIDWTSMVLWAVLMVLTAFMLDYGEHYDWFHSKVIWYLLGFIIITFSMILWRMNNNRHPYISPNVFTKFKFVKPIFILIMIYEAVMGTEYVLEEVFLEEGLDYGTLTNSALVWPVWIGNISGCAIAFLWMQIVNRFTYVRLGMLGTCFLGAYVILMYFRVTPELNIQALYLPLICRGVAYACLSIMFMVSLHDCMDFQHFFQGLMVFNGLHMVIGGCIGCAFYSKGLNYYVAEAVRNFSVFDEKIFMCMGVKTLYGWVAFVCIALLFGFLWFDSPIRRDRKMWKF